MQKNINLISEKAITLYNKFPFVNYISKHILTLKNYF